MIVWSRSHVTRLCPVSQNRLILKRPEERNIIRLNRKTYMDRPCSVQTNPPFDKHQHTHSNLKRKKEKQKEPRGYSINPGCDREKSTLSDLAMARTQQRDMLMKDEEEALVCKVVSMPLSRSLVFSSSSICRGTRFSSSLIWGRYRLALVRISTSCQHKQTEKISL